MVHLSAKVNRTIEQYLRALKQHDIPIQEAFLFGSYAQGTYHE